MRISFWISFWIFANCVVKYLQCFIHSLFSWISLLSGFLIFGQTNVILWFFAIIRDTNISHTYTNDTSMIINDICLSHFVTNNHSIQISEKFNTCAKKSRPFGFLPKPYYSQQNCYCNNSKSHLNDHKKSLERPPLTATKRKLQQKKWERESHKTIYRHDQFFWTAFEWHD